MRPLFSLLLLALFFHFLPAQDAPAEVPVKSTIKSATVYLEGAQVNRAATTAIPAGRRTLVFTGLTTDLDPASIQLSSSAADLLVLSVTHRLNFGERPEDGPAQKQLETGIKDLDRQVRRLLTRAAIAKEEEEMLKANRQVAGEQTGLDAADLERAVKFQRERITAIRMGYLAIEDSLRLLAERREDLQVELLELGPPTDQRATAEVVVETETDRALTTDLTLSYLVPNAGWSPRYDLRVADISRPVDLRYQALVYQRSGEDWTDVALTLSTGDPSLSGRVPELPVWRLRPGARPPVYVPVAKAAVDFGYRTVRGTVTDKETGEPLIGASILIIGAAIGTITDLNGAYELNLPAEAESLRVSYTGYDSREFEIVGNQIDVALESGAMLEEVVVIGYGQQGLLGKLKGAVSGINIGGNRSKKSRDQEADAAYAPVPTTVERRATTTAFTIELPYTIPSDGKSRTVEIRRFSVPAEYRYRAVPKLSAEAYLTAALVDWEQYDLISGPAQLLFEGTYLGESALDVDNTSDTLRVSLGRDPGIVVTRTADKEYRKRGGFLAGRQVDSRGWTIAVRNTKPYAVDLTLVDQVPISGQNSIDVDLDLPAGARLDESTGEVRWRLRLAPGAEEKVRFGYSVKSQRGERVYLE